MKAFAVGDVADVVQGFDLPVAAYPSGELGGGGLAGGQAGDGVDGDGPPLLAGQGPDPAGDADGLGGVREGEPGGDGRGFEGAVLFAAVAAVVLPVTGGDVAPGQVLDLGIQAGLVLLHDQDVMSVLVRDQELGVITLGMQRVCGDHAPGQVQVVQQGGELGDLIGLAVHTDLPEAGASLLIDDRQQMQDLPVAAGIAVPPPLCTPLLPRPSL